MYKSYDLFPFVYIFEIFSRFLFPFMSFTVTFLMDESEDPVISQEAMTSHRAIWWERRNSVFSSMEEGTGQEKIFARTFQKRFPGCP